MPKQASSLNHTDNPQHLIQQTLTDTVYLVYYKSAAQYAKVIDLHKNKFIVRFLYEEMTGKEAKVVKKHVFNLPSTNNDLIPEKLRFIFFDGQLADDIVVNGTVLGFNSDHFLIEFIYEGQKQVTVKHKSEVVQKDLRNK